VLLFLLFDLYCSYFDFYKFKTNCGEYVTTGEDYQSIKVLGKILLNEYMVPFEFASILLLVAMIGTVLLSKEKIAKIR
jgi:NADH-quinone oxidoreductase subunit J